MKKKIYFLSLLSLLWSCNKSTESISKNEPNFKNLSVKSFSAADGAYDLLGYGYDVTKEFANSNSAGGQVLNVADLDVNNPGRVIPGSNKTQYGNVSYGEDAQSFSSDLSEKLTLTSGFKLFKGNLTLSYSSSDASSSKYIYGMYSLIVQQKSWALNADNTLLQNYLSPAFLSDIQNPSTTPEYIVAHYGTHVLSHIILGGKLQVVFQSQTSSSDRKTAAAAGLQVSIATIFSLDAGLNYNSSSTSSNFSQNLSYITHGGDPSKGLIGQIPFSSTAPTMDISNWQNSCTTQNAELIDIDKDGLIAISDLIPSTYPGLKAGVAAYVNQYLIDHQVTVTPAQIYEFYNSHKHAYSTNPNFAALYTDYYLNAQPFKAFYSQYPGTVPIYQFFNPSSSDHVLTASNYHPEWPNYRYDGIVFYAPTSSFTGSVPVYEFNYSASGDHFYSTNSSAAVPFPGWSYSGQPFYVFPN